VLSYIDVLKHGKPVGERVAIIGAGGIGFDVAEFLTHGDHPSTTLNLPAWQSEWGITDPAEARGGLAPGGPRATPPARQVTLLQRKKGKLGNGLGKTTGWIHRTVLKMKRVEMVGGVNYERIGDEGLLVSYGEKREDPTWIPCDTVVLCAGQVPLRSLAQALEALGQRPHLIGGALEAGELDAKRAIDQAARLAARL
jgi:2,4-dienoyl-CoA reductase (NADPH2)